MEAETKTRDAEWRSASFEGARREQLRRWSQLPLERILMAIEEMGEIAAQFKEPRPGSERNRER